MPVGENLFDIAVRKAFDEIEKLISQADLDELETWIRLCHENSSKHENYPRTLQYLINEIGIRLGFKVTRGEY